MLYRTYLLYDKRQCLADKANVLFHALTARKIEKTPERSTHTQSAFQKKNTGEAVDLTEMLLVHDFRFGHRRASSSLAINLNVFLMKKLYTVIAQS